MLLNISRLLCCSWLGRLVMVRLCVVLLLSISSCVELCGVVGCSVMWLVGSLKLKRLMFIVVLFCFWLGFFGGC